MDRLNLKQRQFPMFSPCLPLRSPRKERDRERLSACLPSARESILVGPYPKNRKCCPSLRIARGDENEGCGKQKKGSEAGALFCVLCYRRSFVFFFILFLEWRMREQAMEPAITGDNGPVTFKCWSKLL